MLYRELYNAALRSWLLSHPPPIVEDDASLDEQFGVDPSLLVLQ
jgi:hypothetical protein